MRRRRLLAGLVVPIALVAIVGTLATLQFRWLGQVSAAERDELRASLERRTREFSDDFDREISLAYSLFQAKGADADPSSPEMIGAHLDQWRTSARYPAIVKHVYTWRQIAPEKGERSLARFDASSRTIEPADWPASLEPVRARLAVHPPAPMPDGPGTTQMIALGAPTVVSDVPALLVPIARAMGATVQPDTEVRSLEMRRALERAVGSADVLFSFRSGQDFLIVELDGDVIRNDMLPALADRHFGTGHRVAVVNGKNAVQLTRGLAAGQTIALKDADTAYPLFSLRLDLPREAGVVTRMVTPGAAAAAGWVTPLPSASSTVITTPGVPVGDGRFSVFVEQRTTTTTNVPVQALRVSRGGWQVLVQHPAGSLDAAVSQARNRNLWLSFGILSVLVASVGLIVLNARRSERLAAQQMDFVATVSHELRTPLAVIRSAAQNMSAGVVSDAAQARRYGDLIESEGRRLTDMVEQVLEYAGLSGNRRPLRAKPVDAGHLVQDVIQTSTPQLQAEGFEVRVEIDPATPPMLADEEAIRRALQNLVTNAVKYGAEGRWLGVSVKPATARGRNEVQIAVADRGRGIDAADLPHLFEPFYRGQFALERQIHGNGLGLSLVKRIADAHDGRVAVKSAPGEGTTFTLHLPAATAEAAREVAAEPAEFPGGTSA